MWLLPPLLLLIVPGEWGRGLRSWGGEAGRKPEGLSRGAGHVRATGRALAASRPFG